MLPSPGPEYSCSHIQVGGYSQSSHEFPSSPEKIVIDHMLNHTCQSCNSQSGKTQAEGEGRRFDDISSNCPLKINTPCIKKKTINKH